VRSSALSSSAARQASTSCVALVKRSAASLAMPRAKTASSAAGASIPSPLIVGGGAKRCACMSAASVSWS
jgi:hypothetical protein